MRINTATVISPSFRSSWVWTPKLRKGISLHVDRVHFHTWNFSARKATRIIDQKLERFHVIGHKVVAGEWPAHLRAYPIK